MSHTWHQWEEVASLSRLARCERQGTDCSTVKCAYESQKKLPSCVPFGKLHCSFDRFSAAVSEIHFLLRTSWCYMCQFVRKLHDFPIEEVCVRIMDETVTLILYGGNHLGMTVTDIRAHEARVEINELVAIYVFYDTAFAGLNNERVESTVRWRNKAFIFLNQFSGFRTWRSDNNLWITAHSKSPTRNESLEKQFYITICKCSAKQYVKKTLALGWLHMSLRLLEFSFFLQPLVLRSHKKLQVFGIFPSRHRPISEFVRCPLVSVPGSDLAEQSIL